MRARPADLTLRVWVSHGFWIRRRPRAEPPPWGCTGARSARTGHAGRQGPRKEALMQLNMQAMLLNVSNVDRWIEFYRAISGLRLAAPADRVAQLVVDTLS